MLFQGRLSKKLSLPLPGFSFHTGGGGGGGGENSGTGLENSTDWGAVVHSVDNAIHGANRLSSG